VKQFWVLIGAAVVGCVLLVGVLVFLGDGSPPAAQPAADGGVAQRDDPVAPQVADQAAAPQVAEVAAASPAAASEPAPAGPLTANLELPASEVDSLRAKLRMIALGFLNYESAHRTFPPGRSTKAGQQLSWRVHLLPFLEQEPLYRRFHLNEPWDSPHNKALIDFMPDAYRTGAEEGAETAFVVFRGEGTVFPPDDATSMRHFGDGTSNTLLVVHAGGGVRVPWTKPGDVDFNEAAPLEMVGFVNGRLEGALASAALISLPYDIPTQTVVGLITPRGNELIDGAGLARRYAEVASVTQIPKRNAPAIHATFSPQAPMSRMKNVALGLLNSESARAEFPPSAVFRRAEDPPELAVSWRVATLPFMEQQNLFQRYKFDEPWDGETNRALLSFMPADYRHETTVDDTATRMQVLVGVGTPFGPKVRSSVSDPRRGISARALVDGTSNTIMTVESGRDRAVPWMAPRDLPFDPAAPLESLGELEATGTFAAMFDGSVRAIDGNIDPQVLAHLALYRDEYEAEHPDEVLDWASATLPAPGDAGSQAGPSEAELAAAAQPAPVGRGAAPR
jgi:hypothetical protein